jgi:hypothetical protein
MNRALAYTMLASLVLVAGCSKAPTEKVAAAEQAVNDARTAGAPKYLPEEFAKLESTLMNAKHEIAEQDAKFGLMRDYEKADQMLVAAQADAGRLASETGRKKEESKASALQAQQAAQGAVKNAQDLVAKAPVGKDRAAVQAIKADVEGLASSLPEVQKGIEAEDYQAAQARAKAIQDKSQAVSAEIETALAKMHKPQVAKKKQ